MIAPPDEPPPEERLPAVGFIPVRCPVCRKRDRLKSRGVSRGKSVHYYECRRCTTRAADGRLVPRRFKAVDVGDR